MFDFSQLQVVLPMIGLCFRLLAQQRGIGVTESGWAVFLVWKLITEVKELRMVTVRLGGNASILHPHVDGARRWE